MTLRTFAIVLMTAAIAAAQTPPPSPPPAPPDMSVPAGATRVEQTTAGQRAGAVLVTSFDGLGEGFEGPQGKATVRQPSDNSIAVGPDHVVVTVNSRMAVFTKQGSRFDSSGRV